VDVAGTTAATKENLAAAGDWWCWGNGFGESKFGGTQFTVVACAASAAVVDGGIVGEGVLSDMDGHVVVGMWIWRRVRE